MNKYDQAEDLVNDMFTEVVDLDEATYPFFCVLLERICKYKGDDVITTAEKLCEAIREMNENLWR